jgi:hypothetical protein
LARHRRHTPAGRTWRRVGRGGETWRRVKHGGRCGAAMGGTWRRAEREAGWGMAAKRCRQGVAMFFWSAA